MVQGIREVKLKLRRLFVFFLPPFAIKYFIQRAADFFDWRAGVYTADFPVP